MSIKLDHTILACALHPLLTCVLPCRYLTLAPETAKETFVEISNTEPEDPVGASSSSTTYPGKGEIYTITL